MFTSMHNGGRITHSESANSAQLPAMLFVPAFGDDRGAFEPLLETELTESHRLVLLDLPGFGGSRRLEGATTLESLADVVHEKSLEEQASTIVAHSLASITASLAARRDASPIDTIISLEGNLTAEDAYHSGTASGFDNAVDFHHAFLARLDALMVDEPAIKRYRTAVAMADSQALWELGCDAYRFSSTNSPGAVLTETEDVWYLYNPGNCPRPTLTWLAKNPMRRLLMTGASHWKSVEQPHELAAKILEALSSKS